MSVVRQNSHTKQKMKKRVRNALRDAVRELGPEVSRDLF